MRGLFVPAALMIAVAWVAVLGGPDLAAKAQTVVDLLAKGDYEGAVGMFSPSLREQAPAAEAKQAWEGAQAENGAFQSAGAPVLAAEAKARVVYVPITFARGVFDLMFTFDAEGLVTSLVFVPHQ